jgi:hypothetical protein
LKNVHKKALIATSLTLLQQYVKEVETFLCIVITKDGTWVFHYSPVSKEESNGMKASFLRCHKTKSRQHPGKVMTTVYWDMYGVLFGNFTARGATINGCIYQDTLTRLKEVVRRKRSRLLSHGKLLLQANAAPHLVGTTVNLLNTWQWKILPKPRYSPD